MTDDTHTGFVETKQYHRFKEFCDACRQYRYIGLCYGTPGVGKTKSARQYANWDKVSSYEPLQSSRMQDLPGVLGSTVVFYTVTVVNSAGQVAKDVLALRTMLREIVIEDLHREKDERLDAVRRREQEEIDVLLSRRETAGWICKEVADVAYQAMKDLNEEYWDKVKAAKDPTDLVIVDETDHLRLGGLEQLRAIYDGGRIGMVLIGKPGWKSAWRGIRSSIHGSGSSMSSSRCRGPRFGYCCAMGGAPSSPRPRLNR
jgi:hypothetical protein